MSQAHFPATPFQVREHGVLISAFSELESGIESQGILGPELSQQFSFQTGSNGPYIIYLRDGTILLTRSDFEN
jgi:hypothetical protein